MRRNDPDKIVVWTKARVNTLFRAIANVDGGRFQQVLNEGTEDKQKNVKYITKCWKEVQQKMVQEHPEIPSINTKKCSDKWRKLREKMNSLDGGETDYYEDHDVVDTHSDEDESIESVINSSPLAESGNASQNHIPPRSLPGLAASAGWLAPESPDHANASTDALEHHPQLMSPKSMAHSSLLTAEDSQRVTDEEIFLMNERHRNDEARKLATHRNDEKRKSEIHALTEKYKKDEERRRNESHALQSKQKIEIHRLQCELLRAQILAARTSATKKSSSDKDEDAEMIDDFL